MNEVYVILRAHNSLRTDVTYKYIEETEWIELRNKIWRSRCGYFIYRDG